MMDKERNSRNGAMISASGLTKHFGSEVAVRDLTFDIPPGVIFGFIGPSGAGKTTTIRMLTGIYAPTAGELWVLGRQPWTFTRREREKIGYMAQIFNLYPELTVWENLNFTASLYGLNPFQRPQLEELLDFVELSAHRHKPARQLSGGMQRRLNLAATLVHNPELIFLDEPTAGVDPILRQKLWDYFRRLRDEGHTLFITTQYMAEAAHCDWIGVLGENRLIQVNTPEGLRHAAFGGDILELVAEDSLDYRQVQALRQLDPGRRHVQQLSDNTIRLIVENAGTAGPALIDWCRAHGIAVKTVEEYVPPFDEVFVELVKRDNIPVREPSRD